MFLLPWGHRDVWVSVYHLMINNRLYHIHSYFNGTKNAHNHTTTHTHRQEQKGVCSVVFYFYQSRRGLEQIPGVHQPSLKIMEFSLNHHQGSVNIYIIIIMTIMMMVIIIIQEIIIFDHMYIFVYSFYKFIYNYLL